MLQPVWTLTRLPDWAQRHFYLEIFDVIEEAGGKVRFVGGCVRDELLRRPVKDIDMATTLTPEEVTEAFASSAIKVKPTGIDHGTVTLVQKNMSCEITTLRRDVETDGRRAVVSFTQKWEEDAQRRDFTINTLLMDRQGQIYDPTGQGLNDIKRRRVVFVGDAETRIREDILRMYRYMRFAMMVEQKITPEIIDLFKKNSPAVSQLSSERVTDEFSKMLDYKNVPLYLENMDKAGLIEFNRNVKDVSKVLKKYINISIRYEQYSKLTVFALLAASLGRKNLFSFAFSKKEVAFIEKFEALLSDLNAQENLSHHFLKKQVYYQGKDAVLQALLVYFGDHKADRIDETTLTLLDKWRVPSFPLSGQNLIAHGLKEGARLGEVLRETEDWWVENNFGRDKDACLAHALSKKP